MLDWMSWTVPTAIFFLCIVAMLLAMGIWEVRSPNVPRRGLLPIVTTRGDRLFIGLVAAAFLNLAWIGLTDSTQWIAVALSAGVLAGIGRWA